MDGFENAEAFLKCLVEPNKCLQMDIVEKTECGVTEALEPIIALSTMYGEFTRVSKRYGPEFYSTTLRRLFIVQKYEWAASSSDGYTCESTIDVVHDKINCYLKPSELPTERLKD